MIDNKLNDKEIDILLVDDKKVNRFLKFLIVVTATFTFTNIINIRTTSFLFLIICFCTIFEFFRLFFKYIRDCIYEYNKKQNAIERNHDKPKLYEKQQYKVK